MKQVYTEKTYKLIGKATPLTYILPSRDTKRFPLHYFDKDKGILRSLRYARNQKSPFEDEQDDKAILEPIIFTDGFLTVPETNPVLQWFLAITPSNGKVFKELDKAKEASDELNKMNFELDAQVEARKLTLDQMESVIRVMKGKDPSLMTNDELKRDIIIMAKSNPKGFLAVLGDPDLQLQSKVAKMFDKNILTLRNKGNEIWVQIPPATHARKMIGIPFGQDPHTVAATFLLTEEGIEILKIIDNIL